MHAQCGGNQSLSINTFHHFGIDQISLNILRRGQFQRPLATPEMVTHSSNNGKRRTIDEKMSLVLVPVLSVIRK